MQDIQEDMPLWDINADIQGIIELLFRGHDFPKHLLRTQQEVLCQDKIIHAKRACTFPEKLYAPDDLGILVDRKPYHGCTTDGKLLGVEPGPGYFRDENGSGHLPNGSGKDVTLFDITGHLSL